MAENKLKQNYKVLGLAAAVVLVFVGIIYFAWSTKPADSNTVTTPAQTQDNTPTNAADVDKLGAREVLLTPENFAEVTGKKGVVLVDMYSPTCPHCQKIAPILTQLSDEYGDKLVVAKMSTAIDANREFILNWDKGFQYVPAVTIYKDGHKVESFTGERTKDQFKTLIDKYVK